VDADRFYDGGINFPVLWTQPEFSGVLKKATPVAQILAVPRTAPELVFENFDVEHGARPTAGPWPKRWPRPASIVSAFARKGAA